MISIEQAEQKTEKQKNATASKLPGAERLLPLPVKRRHPNSHADWAKTNLTCKIGFDFQELLKTFAPARISVAT